jgi:hypothetical protein
LRSTVVKLWNRALMIGMMNVRTKSARKGASRTHGARFCARVALVLVRKVGCARSVVRVEVCVCVLTMPS